MRIELLRVPYAVFRMYTTYGIRNTTYSAHDNLLTSHTMLPCRRKLSHASFPSYKEPRRQWDGAILRISCYQRKNTEKTEKFAVTISKKTAKSAVARNRLKRRVFSVVEEHQAGFAPLSFGRYVISVKAFTKEPSFLQIAREIKDFLETT